MSMNQLTYPDRYVLGLIGMCVPRRNISSPQQFGSPGFITILQSLKLTR